MSEIRAIYHGHVPNWPATDQHPDAVRYYVLTDDAIAGEVLESEAERLAIDKLAADRQAAAAQAGAAQRSLEALAADAAERELLAAAAVDLARQEGELGARVMSPEQRAYLRRISDQAARAAFIGMTRRERRGYMEAQPAPRLVLDVVGTPTLAEVLAILNPPPLEVQLV